MKLNRKLVLILALVLSLALATGSTLAYLSDTDADVNVMTLGNVKIVQNEQKRNTWTGELEAFVNSRWNYAYPVVGEIVLGDTVKVGEGEYKFWSNLENEIDKIVTVTNIGKSDAYLRTLVAIEAPDFDPDQLIHFNYNDALSISDPFKVTIDDVDYLVYSFGYAEALRPEQTSAPSLLQVCLDSQAGNDDVAAFGEDGWKIIVLSQATQTAGFANAATALDTAFGAVNDENIAKWFGGELPVGSPGDKAPTNDPPLIVSTPAELEEALANAQPGDKISMEPGDYGVVTLGKNMDNVTIYGNGAEVTKIIVPEGMDYYSTVINGVTFENGNNNLVELNGAPTVGGGCLTFYECTFKGPGTKGGRGISVNTSGARVSLTNCTFDGVSYPVYGNCELSATNCTFKNSASWVYMGYGTMNYTEFFGCTFENVDGIMKNASSVAHRQQFYFVNNKIIGTCGHDNDEAKIFALTLQTDIHMIENNTKDDVAWTPDTANGLIIK